MEQYEELNKMKLVKKMMIINLKKIYQKLINKKNKKFKMNMKNLLMKN